MKNFIVGALIIGVAIVIGFVLQKPAQYGATVGPEHYNQQYFYGGLVQGGGVVTKTSATTTTWTADDVCTYDVIKWVTIEALNTTTVPTAASIINKCLPKVGDFKDIIFWNSGSLATKTASFAMGTYVTAFIPEADGADKIIEGLNYANIRFLRTTATTVAMFINENLVQ